MKRHQKDRGPTDDPYLTQLTSTQKSQTAKVTCSVSSFCNFEDFFRRFRIQRAFPLSHFHIQLHKGHVNR